MEIILATIIKYVFLSILFLMVLFALACIISSIFARNPPYTGDPLARYIKNHGWVIREIEKRLSGIYAPGLVVMINPIKSFEVFYTWSDYYHPSKLPELDWLIIDYNEEYDSFKFIDLDKSKPSHINFIKSITKSMLEQHKKELNNG